MGCTVIADSGSGPGSGVGVESVQSEQQIPIRQFLGETESSGSGVASSGPAVWDKVMTPGSPAYARSTPENFTPEREEVPDRQVSQLPATPRALPSLPAETDIPVESRTPEALSQPEPKGGRTPAMTDAAMLPQDEPPSDARPDAAPASKPFRRTNLLGDPQAVRSTAPQLGEQPQRKSNSGSGEVAINPELVFSSKRLPGNSMQQGTDPAIRSGARGTAEKGAPRAPNQSPASSNRGLATGNKAAAPANSAKSLLSGIVTDAETGLPLAAALVRIDRVDQEPLTTRTDAGGNYGLVMTELPDNVAVTVVRRGYSPESRNLGNRTSQLDFALSPINERIISVEQKPVVHHLGDDNFSGNINSQFQGKAEGPRWTAKFPISQDQKRFPASSVIVSMMAKGMQFPATLRINGFEVGKLTRLSPIDGSFGLCDLRFAPNILKSGENEISIQTAERGGDQDDFEFVNVQLRLIRKE